MEFRDLHQQFDGNQRMEQKDVLCHKRKRYLVAVLTFFGCVSLAILRMNLTLYQINMFSYYIRHVEADFPNPHGVGSSLIVYLLGVLTAPLGAVGVRKFGGAITFGAGVGFTALLTCFTPTLLYWHFSALWIAQALAGMLQGACTCAVLDVLRLWSIPTERGRLIGLATSGFLIGGHVSYPVGRALASENWRILFYVTGVLSLLWCIIWFIIVKNSPEEDKSITTEEKNYIKQSNARNEREANYSCCSIFKSKPVWAYFIERFVISWSGYIILQYLHLFPRRRVNFGSLEIGMLTYSVYYCYPIGVIGASFLADHLKNTNKLNISNVYKLYLSFGQIVVIGLFVLCILEVLFGISWLIVLNFVVFQLILAMSSVGYSVLPVDMGGQYATLIAGFGIVAATLGELVMYLLIIILPSFFRSLTNSYVGTTLCWGLVWHIPNFLGAFIFYKFGSGDLQPWAVSSGSS